MLREGGGDGVDRRAGGAVIGSFFGVRRRRDARIVCFLLLGILHGGYSHSQASVEHVREVNKKSAPVREAAPRAAA